MTDEPGSLISHTLNVATSTDDLTAPTTAQPSVCQVDSTIEDALEDFDIPASKSLTEDQIEGFLNNLRQVLTRRFPPPNAYLANTFGWLAHSNGGWRIRIDIQTQSPNN